MTEKHYYSLDEISKLLTIPKSTLRYWEKEKLISSHRDKDNSYRIYSTSQLIDICEIKFYRDLNFSIADIKKMYANDYLANHKLVEEAKNDLYLKIDELKQTISDIEKYQHRFQLVQRLQHSHLTLERPEFDTLYYFHPGKTKNLIHYLKDPSILSFVVSPGNYSLKHFSTFEKASAATPITTVWDYNPNKKYFCFLLSSTQKTLDNTTVVTYLKEVSALGFVPEKLIGRYLISQEAIDYYQVWLEAIES